MSKMNKMSKSSKTSKIYKFFLRNTNKRVSAECFVQENFLNAAILSSVPQKSSSKILTLI
jgi:hypothetical protein